jgi:4-amino-4-deoxy-L-arabinose transferase-like glycosyltransferase
MGVNSLTWGLRTHAEARRNADTALLLGVCALAAALRFATVGVQSFDYDESYTVGMVLSGSLAHALHTIPITESTPPLYYVLAWFWSRIFGLGEVGLRSLSALMGTALVPVAFVIGRDLGSRRAGLVAAVLVAVNPFLVWYSQEARSYALLAFLSALSFWAFVRALGHPTPRRLALWAVASSLAILTHYFAAFLVAGEAAWLLWATRRRGALLASGAVAAVGGALVPLIISQADNRTQWIEALSLWSRIKEVAKKWATGEIAPTRNWELALVAILVGIPLIYAAARLTERERRGAAVALGVGGLALVIPFVLDVSGLHYLISKNVMPAFAVLLIGGALILGADRAGSTGAVGAAVACAFFLSVTIDAAVDPALQRPDYRAALRALGSPVREQAVVAPKLGALLSIYRPGAVPLPAGGWPAREVVVVQPLPRADVTHQRPPTPAPPPGFVFEGRRDARTYTLICFDSPTPRVAAPGSLVSLAPGLDSSVQVWPRSSTARAHGQSSSPCVPHLS